MEATRLFDCIYHQQKTHPLKKSLGHKKDGKWVYYSTEEVIEKANKISRGLLKLGVQAGDKIALISYQNRPEWVFMDIGMAQIGAINVPVYPTIAPKDYDYIFNDSQVKYVIVGDGDLYDKVTKARPNIPSLIDIYSFDKTEGIKHYEEFWSDEGADAVEAAKAKVWPDDMATIIYTSGTTGNPKGVMLSHKNIMSNVAAVQAIMPHDPGDRCLSFLPLCHIFERTSTYSYLYNSFEVVHTGTDNLGGEDGDLRAVKPHFFTTVPRLLEKVYEKIYNKGLELTGAKKKLFFWALSLTEDYEYGKEYSGMASIKRSIANKLIFSKWREALGGNIKGILTGAAACPTKMKQVFSAAGVPIREGYGLTESSPGLAIGRYDKGGATMSAIGPALAGVEIFIDTSDGNYKPGEGEILAAGDNIMMGYHNNEKATADVIVEKDGKRWLKTGDIGKMVKVHGKDMLKITDRKKELLKTSGGKYVAPAPIESRFKENFLIEQIMVIGEKQKFVSALILPAEEALKDWCMNNAVEWTGVADAIKNEKVIGEYQRICEEYNPEFSHIEQIKKFKLLPVQWEPMKGDGSDAELTPTLKLKRRVIREKHQSDIANIYNV